MIDHVALLNELIKIGEDAQQHSSNRDRLIQALKTVGLAGLGIAAGHGTAHMVEQAFPKFMQAQKPVKSSYVRAVQFGLPILGAVGLGLGSRYQKKVHEGLTGTAPQDASGQK